MGRFFLAAFLLVASISVFLQFEVTPARATTVVWSSSQSVPAGNGYALAYGNGRWTAVAQSGTNRLMTSTDGVTWTTSGLTYNGAAGGPIDGDWRAVRYANNMWLAAGYDGRAMTSSDGLAWSSAGITGLTVNEDITAIAYKTGTWVAVGANSMVTTSADGLVWSSAGVTGVPSAIVLRSVTWASVNNRFVAVGDSSTVIYSSDGVTWSSANVTGVAAGQSLTGIASGQASNGNYRFVIVAPSNTSGSVWSSTNGETWTAGTANTSCTSSQRWNAVGFGNGRWMAARGAGGGCDSISSIFGIQTSWEQPTGGTVAWWNAVAYGNGRWVAVGSNIAMSSAEPSLTPTFDTPVATANGFTVNVTNYNAAFYWGTAPTVSAGTATWGTAVGANRPLTITGLSASTSATVTVAVTRSGFAPGSATVTGTSASPPAALSPTTQTVSGTVGTAVSSSTALTASGFGGAVSYTVTSGSLPTGLQLDQSTGVVSGTPSASSSTTVTITGTSGGTTATAAITFAIIDVSPSPTFGSVTSTADGFTVNITNYDAAYNWSFSVSAGSVSAGTANGSTLPLTVTGLTPGASATITVSTSRSGFANNSATQSGSATSVATTTTTTVPQTTTTVTTPVSGGSVATTTTVPHPVTVASPTPGQSPALVSANDAEKVAQRPGQAGAIVNGQTVAATVERAATPAVSVPPAQRTTAQVAAVQQAAATLIAEFTSSLPQNSSRAVSVSNTDTGAVVNGLLVNPRNGTTPIAVPIENVVMMSVGSSRFLLVGATPNGNPLVLKDGVLQVGAGGVVSVALNGLPASALGEAVLFSTPTLLGSFTTSADGSFSGQFTIPSGIEDGAHSLVLKIGTTTASFGLQLDNSLTMPSTGMSVNSLLILALILLVAGMLSRFVSRHITDVLTV